MNRISTRKAKSAGEDSSKNAFVWRYRSAVLIVFGCAVFGLVAQMYRWQVTNHEKYSAFATSQVVTDTRMPSSRGTIYAADGSVLAVDEPVWDVYASLSIDKSERERFEIQREVFINIVSNILNLDKNELDKDLTSDFRHVRIKQAVSAEEKNRLEQARVWAVYATFMAGVAQSERDAVVQVLADVLNVDRSIFEAEISGRSGEILLCHGVSDDEKTELESHGLAYLSYYREGLFGLYLEESEKRIYPQGKLASHVVGFVGKNETGEDVGNYGLEGYYAGDLLGVEGFTYEEKDSRGNVILTGEYDPVIPREGKNIVLTIQPGLQRRVEELIEKGVKEQEAKSGSVIVMNPKTGAILAMANYPDFNPTYYWNEDNAEVFRNKAVSDVYEFGSVNKVMTLSMALEEGEITPETECIDDTGSVTVIDKTIYTWDRNPDGVLLPRDILKFSNNVCAVKTGQKVGIERFYSYMRKFGIGDFIGIGLQDEATSYLPSIEKWTLVDLAAASFGQAISATPLQIVSAISTIANNGVRMRPYIVDKIYDESEVLDIEPEVAERVVSEKTAVQMQDMMEVVVKEGDPKYWFSQSLSQYSIAGKTGTAEIPFKDRYGYQTDKTNVTFVGFSPVHDAKMVMIVRLEEPGKNTLSAYTVVPVWIDIYKNIALDLGLAPQ